MYRYLGIYLILITVTCTFHGFAQNSSNLHITPTKNHYKRDTLLTLRYIDSLRQLRMAKMIADSIKKVQLARIGDSLQWVYTAYKHISRRNKWYTYLIKKHTTEYNYITLNNAPSTTNPINNGRAGTPRVTYQPWVLILFLVFLTIFVIINTFFTSLTQSIFASFVRSGLDGNLQKSNTESSILRSWIFVVMNILAIFIIGFACYGGYNYLLEQHQTFNIVILLNISLIIGILFVCKIIFMHLLGAIFQIKKNIKKYTTSLYMLLINTSWIALFMFGICLLSPKTLLPYTYPVFGILFCAIFLYKTLSIVANTVLELSKGVFSIFYIILYLCALEICPIFLFAKVISNYL